MPMTVQEIKAAIEQLDTTQVFALADWLDEYKNDRWDEQIEEDANSGRLDKLIAGAEKQYKQGLAKPL